MGHTIREETHVSNVRLVRLNRSLRNGAAASVVLALAACALAPAANATTELSALGTGDQGASLQGVLNGWIDDNFGVDTFQKVPYPGSITQMDRSTDQLAAVLDPQIRSLSMNDKVVVVGLSQGAIGVDKVLRTYVADPGSAPSPENVVFIFIASPDTPGTGVAAQNKGFYNPIVGLTYSGPTPEDTQYHVIFVTQQYDGIADDADMSNVLSLAGFLALANEAAGVVVLHPHYDNVTIDDSTLVKTAGNTKYYLTPTKRLPLLALTYAVADAFGKNGPVEGLVDALNAALKPIIDSQYDRSGYQPLGSLEVQPNVSPAKLPSLTNTPIGTNLDRDVSKNEGVSGVGLGKAFSKAGESGPLADANTEPEAEDVSLQSAPAASSSSTPDLHNPGVDEMKPATSQSQDDQPKPSGSSEHDQDKGRVSMSLDDRSGGDASASDEPSATSDDASDEPAKPAPKPRVRKHLVSVSSDSEGSSPSTQAVKPAKVRHNAGMSGDTDSQSGTGSASSDSSKSGDNQ